MGNNGDDRATESGEEEQAEKVDAVAIEAIRQALLETTLKIGKRGDDDASKICGNAPSFMRLSQGNDTVKEVVLYLHGDYHHDYKILRVLGKSFGNLRALRVVTIYSHRFVCRNEGDDDLADYRVAESLYWQAFTGALGRVRHPIEFRLEGNYCDCIEDFAVAIQGVSTIQSFHFGENTVLRESADILMSALASLPSLESVTLGGGGLLLL